MSLSASVENLTSQSDQGPADGGNMCLELALEGERLCKAGDCRSGIAFFQAAIQAGTDDLRTLSAIYSQLGNAYFYLGDYNKAMQYHKHDLTLARTMGDVLGEAKSSGNLGNTLKVMGKFDEAMVCCKRHLEISRELNDKLSEGRALYNLGNVYHAKGKHIGRVGQQDPGEFPEEVKECLQQAVKYYEENLALMTELKDTAAQGRACGNLGNTHYLLGDFQQAIRYHQVRLEIAREFGDKAAERRANSNLGNSHIFLGEFESAAEHYKRTLVLAQELGDRAVEAQACYSLGNTYTLLRDYQTAIEYHMRHLIIAQQLMDRVGEGRACWSLGNAHSAMGNHDKALYFSSKHLEISKELGDVMGQATAQMNVTDLRKILGLPVDDAAADSQAPCAADRRYRVRRQSMEQLNLIKLTPDGKQHADVPDDEPNPCATAESNKRPQHLDDEESFFDLLSRFQSERMDDQRCSLSLADKENRSERSDVKQKTSNPRSANPLASLSTNGEAQDDLLDLIAGMQSKRMDEQRVALPHLPGLCPPSVTSQNPVIQRLSLADANNTTPDDAFLEMLMRCQGSRLEDQRSSLPEENRESRKAPTVPDEDFFSLILRLQSGRMEDQRAAVPPPEPTGNGTIPNVSQQPAPENKKEKKKKYFLHCLKHLDDLKSDDDNGFLSTSESPLLTTETKERSKLQMPGPGAQLGSLYPPSDGMEGGGGGMMLGEHSQLRNPLICCLCDDYFADPCLLQCYHTFCSKCLRGRDGDGHISCPVCGTTTTLKDNKTLPPPDDLMKQLMELVNAENPPCSNCDKRDKNSMFFCSTCGQALCHQCRETIHRAKMFSSHDIVPMSKCSKDVQKRCPLHGELYIMFNSAKKTMLCVTCFRDTPNEARIHCIDIDAAYAQCSKKLDRAVVAVCEVQNSIRDGLLMFKGLLEELRHNMDCEKHTINTFCQGMQESMVKTHSNMIMEVQRQYESKERSFREQVMTLGTLLPIVQLHLLLCQSFTNIANKYQFLDLAYPMIERLSAINQLVQPQRPVQSSQIRTNYKNEFMQSLEPWIGKINQPISHAIPTQDTNIFDQIPAIPLPNPVSHSGPSKRQQNVLKTKALEGEGPFSNHCRSFDSQVKELTQQISVVKERLGDLHRDVALLRRVQTPPLMTRYQHITGDCTILEEQIERHRVELERMKNVFETLWEEQLCRIHVEKDIFQSQMNEILNLLAEVKHLCLVAQKLEPYIQSLTNTQNVQVSQQKGGDQKISSNQQVQELNLHNQQLHSLLEHLNSLQIDSQKLYSQSIISPTGTKGMTYTKGDIKDKESRLKPRTPSQSPGTMAAVLDQSGNVVLYETQRAQQTTPSDGGEKRGVISQLFEKVRTKDDRKKSPEDRERGHREKGKSDTRSEIIRTKASIENVHEQSTQRPQSAAATKVKGKKDQRYGREGKVASIYQSISGKVLGTRSDHSSEAIDLKDPSRLPPPPPPTRKAPSQDYGIDIRERLENHLKEKLQDMLSKSNVNKHISQRTEKSRSLEAETIDDLNYQRIVDALAHSPEDRKTTRAIIHQPSSSRTGSTATSPRRREEYRESTHPRERSRERRDRRDRSRDRSRESRDRSRNGREKERERLKPMEGRERSKERRERRDKYGRCYPASDTEDAVFYPGNISKKQNSCDSLTVSTVSVDSRKSSVSKSILPQQLSRYRRPKNQQSMTDLGDRKTLVLVIGSGKSKQRGVHKQRSWETFPPKRKSFDLENYGRPHRDSHRLDYRPSSALDGCRMERGHISRDREREPIEGTLQKADSFEGHEEAVRTLVAAVHQTRSQQQQQIRKARAGGNVSN